MTDGMPTGLVPEAIAYGAGSLWVANHDALTVTRIDQASGKVVADGPRDRIMEALQSGRIARAA